MDKNKNQIKKNIKYTLKQSINNPTNSIFNKTIRKEENNHIKDKLLNTKIIIIKDEQKENTKIILDEKKSKEEIQKDKETHNSNEIKINELQKQLNSIENEYNEISKKNINLKYHISSLEKEITNKKNITITKKTKLNSLKDINLKLEKELSDLQKELEEELNREENNEEENRQISFGQLFQNIMERMHNNNQLNNINLEENEFSEEENNNDNELSIEQLLNLPNSKYNRIDNNEEKCVICSFEFCFNDSITKLERCGHIFHRDCLFNLLQNRGSSKCPICKINIFV